MIKRGYIVRPSPKGPRTDLKDVFWIYLSPANLLLHGLRPRDICQIQTPQGSNRMAILLDNAKIQDSVVQTSQALREIYGINLGDNISLSRCEAPVPAVDSIILSEVLDDNRREAVPESEYIHWAWAVSSSLKRAEYISVGMKVDVDPVGQLRTFKVVEVNKSNNTTVYRYDSGSEVHVKIGTKDKCPSSTAPMPSDCGPSEMSKTSIAGLDRQIQLINDRIVALGDDRVKAKFRTGYPSRQGGIIIHGPSGTGKTLLLDHLADCNRNSAFRLIFGGKNQRECDDAVRQVFAEAHRSQPSVITIDRLDAAAGKSRDLVSTIDITQSLGAEMDRLGEAKILVVAVATSLSNISDDLRSPGRFYKEVETTVPDARSRTRILEIMSGFPGEAESQMLQNIGHRTHGYVGADLLRLILCALDIAEARVLAAASTKLTDNTNGQLKSEVEAMVIEDDLNAALLEVRPSAMREVFLETPKVRWSDIGGQQEVKGSLKKAIEWPLKHVNEMKFYGQEPKKGLLLYGPPGCSKTLVAKALATEVDLNFIAVKGAELLSMYVGESERAVREIFQKARAASPSIVFFDEIDALGASRKTSDGGLNVLTTLLNELDGIEDLKGVFILGATNNPAILDPALIRPGRFSKLIYVGLPDIEARAEILQLRLRNVDKDVNIPQLARATEGYSGAEIVQICQNAGENAMEKWLECDNGSSLPGITMEQLLHAIEATGKGVTADQLHMYEQWRADRS